MDLHESTPRKYNLDIDYWVSPFRKPSRHALREAAGRTERAPTTSSPRPIGLQNDTTSKQDADVGSNSVDMTSRTQLNNANQSRDLQVPSEGLTIDSENCTESKQDMNLGPRRVIMPSLTQRTPGRLSLINPPPSLPGILGPQKGPSSKSKEDIRSSRSQRPPRAVSERASPLKILPKPPRTGLQGPHNESPKHLFENLNPRLFEIAPPAQSKKAIQPSIVPVLRRPPRIRPRNRFNVLRPDPYRVPSRVQREAVFRAVERLRALEPDIIIPLLELPAEIRLIIYEHALTSRSPITPRLTGAQEAESKETQTDAAESSAQANVSNIALLQTCWLVNREARPVYFASNAFRVTCAKDLCDFLLLTGRDLVTELRKLHIEGLSTFKPTFTEEVLESYRRGGMPDSICQILASKRTAELNRDAKIAARMLWICKRLLRIHFTMGRGEEMNHYFWLRRIVGYGKTIIDVADNRDRWVFKLRDSDAGPNQWFSDLLADPKTRQAFSPELEEGQERHIDVDINIKALSVVGKIDSIVVK